MNKMRIIVNLFLRKGGVKRAQYLKKHNIFAEMGKNCYYHPFLIPSEPKLVRFHNNILVATGVTFVTHDILAYMFNNICDAEKFDYRLGCIELNDNVFIGANALIMNGVSIGPNAIVGAGSVVTKNVEPGTVVAGNPARVVGSFENVREKLAEYSTSYQKRNRLQSDTDYFWKCFEERKC